MFNIIVSCQFLQLFMNKLLSCELVDELCLLLVFALLLWKLLYINFAIRNLCSFWGLQLWNHVFIFSGCWNFYVFRDINGWWWRTPCQHGRWCQSRTEKRRMDDDPTSWKKGKALFSFFFIKILSPTLPFQIIYIFSQVVSHRSNKLVQTLLIW